MRRIHILLDLQDNHLLGRPGLRDTHLEVVHFPGIHLLEPEEHLDIHHLLAVVLQDNLLEEELHLHLDTLPKNL